MELHKRALPVFGGGFAPLEIRCAPLHRDVCPACRSSPGSRLCAQVALESQVALVADERRSYRGSALGSILKYRCLCMYVAYADLLYASEAPGQYY